MKMMKKLAMSLALGLGLSLLGGGQGTVAQQAQRSVFADLDQDAEIILQEMNKGLPPCGNVLVAHVELELGALGRGNRYVILQSGLAKNASNRLRETLVHQVACFVLDGAEVIGIVSGTPEERRKQIVEDIRTLAGGRRLTGQGRTYREKNANVRERLEDIILALQIYVAKCQTAGLTACPNWARRINGHGITKIVDVDHDPFRLNWEESREWTLRYFGKLNQQSKMNVLILLLQYLYSGQGTDYNPRPRDGHFPQSFADDCTESICQETGINFNSQDAFKIYNSLRWFRYALHTEIQLALLTHLEEGQKVTLVNGSPILSLKDPCPSCEQGANNAWNHQDHKFFSIQADNQGDKHRFREQNGGIISRRYCTWSTN